VPDERSTYEVSVHLRKGIVLSYYLTVCQDITRNAIASHLLSGLFFFDDREDNAIEREVDVILGILHSVLVEDLGGY
jgi:hypothetical protein